jgi:hypothetical protein
MLNETSQTQGQTPHVLTHFWRTVSQHYRSIEYNGLTEDREGLRGRRTERDLIRGSKNTE